jgi:hypothetical protein
MTFISKEAEGIIGESSIKKFTAINIIYQKQKTHRRSTKKY